jgi:hypothetical protein
MIGLFQSGSFSDDLLTARLQFSLRMIAALVLLTVFAILFTRWRNRRDRWK